MHRKFLAFALVVILAACAEEPVAIQPLTLDYTRYGKISLAVKSLEFTNRASMVQSKGADYFARFQPQLADAVYRWGVDRLQASGHQGNAILVIQNAELSRQILPKHDDIGSWFTRQQGERWNGSVSAELRVQGADGNFTGKAIATVSRSTTLPEDPTENEKQGAYRRLLLGMLDDLNTQMDQAIREHLNPIVAAVP